MIALTVGFGILTFVVILLAVLRELHRIADSLSRVSIMRGPRGDQGFQGMQGPRGEDALYPDAVEPTTDPQPVNE